MYFGKEQTQRNKRRENGEKKILSGLMAVLNAVRIFGLLLSSNIILHSLANSIYSDSITILSTSIFPNPLFLSNNVDDGRTKQEKILGRGNRF